jgi:protoporphyrinogen/coproporphyrinogen III oxidase
MRKNESVAVIGAGIAGLTAANYLRRHGVPVRLFEAGRTIAGMASSHSDADGFSYDFGAHFITNRLAAAIGISAKCRDVRYYGESVYLNGRSYSYPFGLMRVPRFLRSGLAAKLAGAKEFCSAADWFRAQYGRALADEVALPLLEAWSGAPANNLSVAVGAKLQNGVAYTIYLRLAARLMSRAIANGYSREMPENPGIWHVYPEGGVSSLCHKLAEGLDDSLHMESPVETIFVDAGRVKGIRAAGREYDAAAVISTAPCHVLANMVDGTNALDGLKRFRYRPMIFVNLKLDCRGVLPDTVLWIPQSGYPFFRLTETMLSMPWLAPEGKTIITADIGCERGDHYWTMSDDDLGSLCLNSLTRLFPDVRDKYLGCRVLRTPIAYPVFLNEYEADRRRFETGTGIAGLWSIGRNGEFAHILMEDVYWRTLRKMNEVKEYVALRPAVETAVT